MPYPRTKPSGKELTPEELDELFPPLTDDDAAELERRFEDDFTPSGRRRSPKAAAARRAKREADEWARKHPEASPRRSGRRTRPTRPRRQQATRRARSSTPRRSYRRAARQLQAPIEQQLTSGMRVIGLTLSIVALYLLLTNAGPFSGVLQGANRGLLWLSDPTRSITYAPGTAGG